LNNLAVLLQANGETARAANYFADAIQRFPNYMDATHNAKLVRDGVFQLEDARFTWRELRPVLTNYVS
jgi:Flp pilus assembly protein TadD